MNTNTGFFATTPVNTTMSSRSFATVAFSGYDCEVIEAIRFATANNSIEHSRDCAYSEAACSYNDGFVEEYKSRFIFKPSNVSENDWQLWQSIAVPTDVRYLLVRVSLHKKAIDKVYGYSDYNEAVRKIQAKSYKSYYSLNKSGDCSLIQYNRRAFVSYKDESWVWQVVKIS